MNESSPFATMRMTEWLDAIASRTPAPGGGAVAASTLATAAALGRMVLAYTIGRDRFAEHDVMHRACDARLAEDVAVLPDLAQRDADGYAALNRLLRRAPDDPARADGLGAALDAAIGAPMEMAERGARLAADLLALVGTVNPWLGSDLAIAGDLAGTGTRAAVRNVLANLDHVVDEGRRTGLARRAATLRQAATEHGSRCEATAVGD